MTEALAQEIKRREGAEQQAGEMGQRRQELEAELAEHRQVQAQLQQQLEAVQSHLRVLKENYLAEQAKLETWTRHLQAAQLPVDQKVKCLTEALALETKRREAVERLAVDAFKRRRELEAKLAKNLQAEKALLREMDNPKHAKGRGELEAELTENKRTRVQLLRELEESEKQLQAQQEGSGAERTKPEARPPELQEAQAELLQRVQRLTAMLAEEKIDRAKRDPRSYTLSTCSLPKIP